MKRLPVVFAVLLIILLVTSTVVFAAPQRMDLSTCSGTYTVVAGDTLSLIASKCGVTASDLQALNPGITNPDLIFVGQVLNLTGTPTSTAATTTTTTRTTAVTRNTYTTVSGDTLASIARSHDMSVETLVANNPSLALAPGQVLTLNLVTGAEGIAPGEVKAGKYLAVTGDTLRTLATKFHTSVDYMLKYNPNITNPDQSVAGLIIILPSM